MKYIFAQCRSQRLHTFFTFHSVSAISMSLQLLTFWNFMVRKRHVTFSSFFCFSHRKRLRNVIAFWLVANPYEPGWVLLKRPNLSKQRCPSLCQEKPVWLELFLQSVVLMDGMNTYLPKEVVLVSYSQPRRICKLVVKPASTLKFYKSFGILILNLIYPVNQIKQLKS